MSVKKRRVGRPSKKTGRAIKAMSRNGVRKEPLKKGVVCGHVKIAAIAFFKGVPRKRKGKRKGSRSFCKSNFEAFLIKLISDFRDCGAAASLSGLSSMLGTGSVRSSNLLRITNKYPLFRSLYTHDTLHRPLLDEKRRLFFYLSSFLSRWGSGKSRTALADLRKRQREVFAVKAAEGNHQVFNCGDLGCSDLAFSVTGTGKAGIQIGCTVDVVANNPGSGRIAIALFRSGPTIHEGNMRITKV